MAGGGLTVARVSLLPAFPGGSAAGDSAAGPSGRMPAVSSRTRELRAKGGNCQVDDDLRTVAGLSRLSH